MKDITLNYYDLEITNGDFIIDSDSSQQETDLIINTNLGNWFQFPLVGVGIINYLASPVNALTLSNNIKKQLVNDGFIVDDISVNGSTINDIKLDIQAHR